MAKHLRHSAFANTAANISGLEWQVYSTQLEETEAFEDLFNPSFWRHHASGIHTLRERDFVRVLAADESWDVIVTIDKLVPGGATIKLYAGIPPLKYHGMHFSEIRELLTKSEDDFECVRLDRIGKPIPRVEQLASGWRVVGNDNEVVEQGIRSKTHADNQLDRYLRQLGLRMPTPAEAAQHKSDIEAREAEQAKAIARKSPATGPRKPPE